MRHYPKKSFFIMALIGVGVLAFAEQSEPAGCAPLPVTWTPFAREGAVRQQVVMTATVGTDRGKALDVVNFHAGDKRVMVSGEDAKVNCNEPMLFGRLVVYLGTRHWLVLNLGPAASVKTDRPDELTVDRAAGTATWRREYNVPGTDGETAVFSYRVSGAADSKVNVDYDFGVPQEKANRIGQKFHSYTWCNINYGGDVTKNVFGAGDVPFQPIDIAAFTPLMQKNPEKHHLQTGGKHAGDVRFFHEPDNEELHFEIFFPTNALASGPWYHMLHRTGPTWDTYRRGVFPVVGLSHFSADPARTRPVKGRIVIDLCMSSVAKHAAEPPVGGIDFWASDALHVPPRPTRNLLVNGSFEQGLKHWRWEDGGSVWDPPAEGDREKYAVVGGGLFGAKMMELNASQPRMCGICSAALPLEAGKRYTVSVWFKVRGEKNGYLSLWPKSVAMRGNRAFMKFLPDPEKLRCHWNIKPEEGWKRVEYTFSPDSSGIYLQLGGANVFVDGIQVEAGVEATANVDDPVIAHLITSDPDNDLVPGEDYAGHLSFVGTAGLPFDVRVRVANVYHETCVDEHLSAALDAAGRAEMPFVLPPERLGEGVFTVRYDFRLPDGCAWTDYERFSIMVPCNATHATKRFFCSHMWFGKHARTPHMAKKFVEWGFGSVNGVGNDTLTTSTAAHFFRDYDIQNIVHPVAYERLTQTNAVLRAAALAAHPELAEKKSFSPFRYIEKATPEVQAALESCAYELAKNCATNDLVWTYWNEDEDCARRIGFDEYFKLQYAVWKGAKRAFDERGLKLGFTPTHGTSHYFRGRNYDVIDGYLETAQKHGFSYSAVSIHPYSNIDGGILGPRDADVETQHLIARMAHYGYAPDVPVYFTECFNMLPMNIPEWGAHGWGDRFRGQQMPSLAAGVREFTHAASLMRLYLIALKFWPKVRMAHPWQSAPVFDLAFSPRGWSKVPNTLARLLPDPRWAGDAQPFGDVRGYCFNQKREDGSTQAILAVWTTNHDAELGRRKGPVVQMALPAGTAAYDMNGNRRALPKPVDGRYEIPLTPAPLFLAGRDAAALLQALEDAASDDPATALVVDVRPDERGVLSLVVDNVTKKTQEGELTVNGRSLPYAIPARGTEVFPIVETPDPQAMTLYTWEGHISTLSKPWRAQWFYVDECGAVPDWASVRAIPLVNEVRAEDGRPVAMKAAFKAAYNADFFFLRVDVEDPAFVPLAESQQPFRPQHLYAYDGCLEVFFDGFADARSQGEKDYDENDMRYDFAQGHCWRQRAVNWQLAQGTQSATDEEIRTKMQHTFTRTAQGYVYEIAIAKRYMAPVDLKPGTVAGLGLYLHDYVKPDERVERGLSFAVESGATCDRKPYLWPTMILRSGSGSQPRE